MAGLPNYDRSMSGREEVIKAIKKRRKPALIMFWTFTVIFLILGVVGFIIENYVMVVIGMIFILPFLIPAIIFLVLYVSPEKHKPIKNNPETLSRADSLFANMAYQNDMIIASPQFFAMRTDPSKIIAMNEVLLMYKKIVHTNYSTLYYLDVETVRGSVMFPCPARANDVIDQTVNVVAPYCQYIRLGYNNENLNYVEYMRTMWAEAQNIQGNQNGQ
jgi:hypothetical protein